MEYSQFSRVGLKIRAFLCWFLAAFFWPAFLAYLLLEVPPEGWHWGWGTLIFFLVSLALTFGALFFTALYKSCGKEEGK